MESPLKILFLKKKLWHFQIIGWIYLVDPYKQQVKQTNKQILKEFSGRKFKKKI